MDYKLSQHLAAAGAASGMNFAEKVTVDEIYKQVGLLTAQQQAWNDKCHCTDVDLHAGRLSSLETQMKSLILHGSLSGVTASAGAASSSGASPFTAGLCGSGLPHPGAHRDHGAPGGSSGGTPDCFSTLNGGNGVCHCHHLEKLAGRVARLEQGRVPAPGPRDGGSRQPFLPSMRSSTGDHSGDPGAEEEFDPTAALKLRPLGLLAGDKHDRQLYDDKLTTQAEYRYDGMKGGTAWKSRVERYFISKVPALREILRWAELHDKAVITEESFSKVVDHEMNETKQQLLNAAVWGFLSQCLAGTAETMFKQAEMLNGLDGWRRVVRVIDNGLPLQLEQLRGEVRLLHTRPIKDLDSVATGIAEFEAKLKEYKEAGGTGFDKDQEMKSDLLSILPARLREDLLWNASGKESYIEFRDMVITQTARILFDRRRGGINIVNDAEDEDEDEHDGPDIINSLEDLIAVVNRYQRQRQGPRANQRERRSERPGDGDQRDRRSDRRSDGDQRDRRGDRRNDGGSRVRDQSSPVLRDDQRRPRRCANCGQTHPEIKCPHPAVARDDRTCWDCGKKNHVARNCPNKGQQNRALRAIEDMPFFGKAVSAVDMPFFGKAVNAVYEPEFQMPKKTVRPVPRDRTLLDFIPVKVMNKFGPLNTDGDHEGPEHNIRQAT